MTKLWYYISGNDIFREFTLWTRSNPGESRKTISDSGSRRCLRRWASYQIHKIAGWARFPRHWLQRKPLVSDPGMHHGTCVTHVPWWMSGSLTRGGGENAPDIPGACTTRNFTYLARGPWLWMLQTDVNIKCFRQAVLILNRPINFPERGEHSKYHPQWESCGHWNMANGILQIPNLQHILYELCNTCIRLKR